MNGSRLGSTANTTTENTDVLLLIVGREVGKTRHPGIKGFRGGGCGGARKKGVMCHPKTPGVSVQKASEDRAN